MTRDERGEIKMLTDFVRDWRDADERWKADTDKRLRGVEAYVAASQARGTQSSEAGLTRRARAALVISALAVASSLTLGIIGLLRP